MITLGIIGVGNMGKNHVRLARELKDIYDLAAVFDPDSNQVEALGLTDIACSSEEDLLGKVDALVVAAPSSMHKRIGLAAAEAGVHVLMEKPLALSEADAEEVVDAFKSANKVLMVDQVERFNPVVRELEKILANEVIIGIDIKRCSPKDTRISDTDVIYDLMIHDIDILMNAIMPCRECKSLAAFGTNSYSKEYADYVQSLLQFENNVVASIVSSRATEGKIRKVFVHCERSYIEADLLNRTLTAARKTRYSLDLGYTPLYSQENVIERVFVPNVEPLKESLKHFAFCIDNGETPITSGVSTLRSLAICDKVKEAVYGL